MHKHTNRGFTLGELMTVVAIIGILAAIAIPSFLRFQLKSKTSEVKINIASIRNAQQQYHDEHGVYATVASYPLKDPTAQKRDWNEGSAGFAALGFAPDSTFFSYQTVGNEHSFVVYAEGDLDGDGRRQRWVYKMAPAENDGSLVSLTGLSDLSVPPGFEDCAGGATIGISKNLLNTVGPCDSAHGRSVF